MKKDIREIILFIQWFLNETGEELKRTGKINLRTIRAIRIQHPNLNDEQDQQKIAIKFIQMLATGLGIDTGPVDGLFGPQTDEAFQQVKFNCGYPGAEEFNRGSIETPQKDGLMFWPNDWPSESNMEEFFGKPGENLVSLALPYPMKLAWDESTIIKTIQVNRKVHDSMGRCLQKELEVYGNDVHKLGLDLFGGCYNNRNKRGSDQISTHAYAAAIDRDPMNNRLRWDKNKASLAKDIFDDMHWIWQDEGWISLGMYYDFDWMHFQAVRV